MQLEVVSSLAEMQRVHEVFDEEPGICEKSSILFSMLNL